MQSQQASHAWFGLSQIVRALRRHLGPHTKLLLRLGVIAAMALAVGLFVLAVPARYAELMSPPRWLVNDLTSLGIAPGAYAVLSLTAEILTAVIFVSVAATIARRRPDSPVALLTSLALVMICVGIQPTVHALSSRGLGWYIGTAALHDIGFVLLALFCYLFPDGRFVPRWTVWALPLTILHALAWRLPAASPLFPGNWPFPLMPLAKVALGSLYVGAQIYRYRRTTNVTQRQQTKWIVYGASLAIGLGVLVRVMRVSLPNPAAPGAVVLLTTELLNALAMIIVPLTIGFATLRYRLWDIDPLINRTLVYGVLTAGVVAIYVFVVAALGSLFESGGGLFVSLIATGMVAVLFQPLRERLQRQVNRLMYGRRDEPYSVLSRLGRRLEATIAPEAVLPTIIETAAQALRLPYVAIALSSRDQEESGPPRPPFSPWPATLIDQTEIVAAYGTPAETTVCLPLNYQYETVGTLLLAPRAPGESFSLADRRLLADLARQAGIAVHAVRLHAELRRSRERLVTAREEERRRLRRDLHDGLGPELASHTLRLEAARDLLDVAPERAGPLLDELIGQSQAMLGEIRRVVYALRPPALDELGLVAAIRQQAAQFEHKGVQLRITAPERLPPLPAAVEVAALRIAQEALNNVFKHARARSCDIVLDLVGSGPHRTLSLEIRDDGVGLPTSRPAGVGMSSMRERAEELGGACVVATRSRGGTRVSAFLPAADVA